MPGTFLVHRGAIVKAQPAKDAAERADLEGLGVARWAGGRSEQGGGDAGESNT